MTSQAFLSTVLDWLLADPTHIVAAASGLAALIPTPPPASIAGKLYQIIDILALNILHAKEPGPLPPPGNDPKIPPAAGAQLVPAPMAALVTLSLCLSACANQTPQKDVFELRAAYDATVLAPLVRYHALPLCSQSSGICKSADIDAQLISADKNAKAALDAAEAVVLTNPATEDQEIVATAQAAIAMVQTILTTNGIH